MAHALEGALMRAAATSTFFSGSTTTTSTREIVAPAVQGVVVKRRGGAVKVQATARAAEVAAAATSAGTKIRSIKARQIVDSRGNPTVEVDLVTDQWYRSAVPSGASTGIYEALELRDGGKAFGGKGVLKAVDNINNVLAKKLVGLDTRYLLCAIIAMQSFNQFPAQITWIDCFTLNIPIHRSQAIVAIVIWMDFHNHLSTLKRFVLEEVQILQRNTFKSSFSFVRVRDIFEFLVLGSMVCDLVFLGDGVGGKGVWDCKLIACEWIGVAGSRKRLITLCWNWTAPPTRGSWERTPFWVCP